MADVTKKVQEYTDKLKQQAEHLITQGFPEKIVKLNELLETSNFQHRDLADIHQDLNIPVPHPPNSSGEPNAKRQRVENASIMTSQQGTSVCVLPNGSVPCNRLLSDLIDLVKPHIRGLMEDSNLLKMWILVLIPKIEDGNNSGVSIQAGTLAYVKAVESLVKAYFNQISQYFSSRADMVFKVAQNPHIDDYRRAVTELDEKQYLYLCFIMHEIRNRYCYLHDSVIKNLEKIKKPRTSNTEALY